MSKDQNVNFSGVSNWQVTAPHPSTFSAFSGDPTKYVVHILVLDKFDDDFLSEQIRQFLFVTLTQLSLTSKKTTSRINFLFDVVVSTLIVTGSDWPQTYEEGHVFKLVFTPWYQESLAENDDLSDDKFDSIWERFKSTIRLQLSHSSLRHARSEVQNRGIEMYLARGAEDDDDLNWELL